METTTEDQGRDVDPSILGESITSEEPQIRLAASSPKIKRRRLRACDGCRQRKIRCDSNPGSCHNCQIYRIDCVQTRTGIGTRRIGQARPVQEGPGVKRSSAIMQNDEALLQTQPLTQHNEDQSSPPKSGVHDSSHPRAVNQIRSPSGQAQAQAATYSPYTPMTDPVQGVVITEVGRFPRKSKYVGMSSVQTLAKSAEELFKDRVNGVDVMKFFCPFMKLAEEVQTPSVHISPLVEKAAADKFVARYFASIHRLFPFMDQRNFDHSYKRFYLDGNVKDAGKLACILLVIALGADYIDDFDIQSKHFSAAWELYPQIVASPFITSVQALLLMTLNLMNFNKDGQAILTVGSAIRIAQSIGLHRSLAAHTHPYEKEFVRKEQDLRSRVWWSCYCLDKKLCFEGGRPSAINDSDCDADMPSPLPLDEPTLISHGLELADPPFSFFLTFIPLCKIISKISSHLFHRDNSPQSEEALLHDIAALDTDLLAWKGTLHPVFQPDQELAGIQDDILYTAVSLLHCVFHNTITVIHRAALLGVKSQGMVIYPNSRIIASDLVCLNAARALGRSINDFGTRNAGSALLKWTIPYSLTVVFALYIGIMKTPFRWSWSTDFALMQTMGEHVSTSNCDTFTIENFSTMINSLSTAIMTVRSRHGKFNSGSSKPGGLNLAIQPSAIVISTTSLPRQDQDFLNPNSSGYGLDHSHDNDAEMINENGHKGNNTADNNNFSGMSQMNPSEDFDDGKNFANAYDGRGDLSGPGEGGFEPQGFQFQDFFGDGPSALDMHFWPTGPWDLNSVGSLTNEPVDFADMQAW